MDIALVGARLLLAVVFLVAGAAKLADRAGSRQGMIDFGLPRPLATPLGLALPLFELAVAIALIPEVSAWWGALGALLLLGVFIAAIAVNLVRGRRPDCRCFGQIHSSPVGWPTLIRNGLLAAVAGLLVSRGPQEVGPNALAWVTDLTTTESIGLAAVVLLAAGLGICGALLLNLLRQNGRLLLRIESLEGRLDGAGIAPTLDSTEQEEEAGLPVGSPAPAFSLSGLHGETLTLDALRVAGKPVLLVFTDANCGPCNALLPEIAAWQRDHSAQLISSLISRGSVEANLEKSSEHGIYNVLVQQDNEVADAYGVPGTPSAVVVAPEGTISGPVAVGGDAIRNLVQSITGRSVPVEAPTLTAPQPDGSGNGAEATPARSGLPVGDMAPGIRLPDLRGKKISLASMRGTETMVLFWDPGCGYCSQILEDLKAWEADSPEGAPKLLVISTGSAPENRALRLRSQILLDEGFSAGTAFAAAGTPTAVIVDEDGKIASEMAVGGQAVLDLARGEFQGSHAASAVSASSIGDPAPSVRLPDLSGKSIDLVDFRGKETLLLFWNPGCGFCQRMLDDLKAWEANPPEGAPELLVVSTGSAEANRELGIRSPILLDQTFSVAASFGADGTPMAVLVDVEGRIASELASGAPAVLALASGADQPQATG
jgi:peroxiredoxin